MLTSWGNSYCRSGILPVIDKHVSRSSHDKSPYPAGTAALSSRKPGGSAQPITGGQGCKGCGILARGRATALLPPRTGDAAATPVQATQTNPSWGLGSARAFREPPGGALTCIETIPSVRACIAGWMNAWMASWMDAMSESGTDKASNACYCSTAVRRSEWQWRWLRLLDEAACVQ